MIDPYIKYQNMTIEQLTKETESLTRKLFSISQTSPLYDQVLNLLDIAEQAYGEKLMMAMHEKDKDEVIEIGSIASETIYPDYSKDELLNIIVSEYRKDSK